MGEGVSSSVKERQSILQGLISQGIDPAKFIVVIMACSVQDALALAHSADDSDCCAILVAPPFYYRGATEEGILAHFRQIIKECTSKVLLYHIPQFTGVPITLEMIDALHSEFPDRIIGFKESEGNWDLAKAVVERLPKLVVMVGHENQIKEAVAAGAAGSRMKLLQRLLMCIFSSLAKKHLILMKKNLWWDLHNKNPRIW